jgi:hypothetical protein
MMAHGRGIAGAPVPTPPGRTTSRSNGPSHRRFSPF